MANNNRKSYASNKANQFISNLAEVLCAASLSEKNMDDIYKNIYFKDSNGPISLRINFKTLNVDEVYQRYQILEKRVSHEKRVGGNRYFYPHEFSFICEKEEAKEAEALITPKHLQIGDCQDVVEGTLAKEQLRAPLAAPAKSVGDEDQHIPPVKLRLDDVPESAQKPSVDYAELESESADQSPVSQPSAASPSVMNKDENDADEDEVDDKDDDINVNIDDDDDNYTEHRVDSDDEDPNTLKQVLDEDVSDAVVESEAADQSLSDKSPDVTQDSQPSSSSATVAAAATAAAAAIATSPAVMNTKEAGDGELIACNDATVMNNYEDDTDKERNEYQSHDTSKQLIAKDRSATDSEDKINQSLDEKVPDYPALILLTKSAVSVGESSIEVTALSSPEKDQESTSSLKTKEDSDRSTDSGGTSHDDEHSFGCQEVSPLPSDIASPLLVQDGDDAECDNFGINISANPNMDKITSAIPDIPQKHVCDLTDDLSEFDAATTNTKLGSKRSADISIIEPIKKRVNVEPITEVIQQSLTSKQLLVYQQVLDYISNNFDDIRDEGNVCFIINKKRVIGDEGFDHFGSSLDSKRLKITVELLPDIATARSCMICRKETCKLDYGRSSPMKSTAGKIFSVVWRKNSCSIDSIFACMQMIYLNLSNSTIKMFHNQYKNLAAIIRNLNFGIIDNHESKYLLECELDNMLKTNDDLSEKIRNHRIDIQATEVSEIIANYSQSNLIFLSHYIITFQCMHCKNTANQLYEDNVIFSFKRGGKCDNKGCEKVNHDISGLRSLIATPVILMVAHTMWQGDTSVAKDLFVEGEFLLDNYQHFRQEYQLMACVYGGNSHFTCMARKNKEIYYCDGMVNNAQYIRLSGLNHFPMKYKSKTVNQAFYIRKDALLPDVAVDRNEDLHQSTCNAATRTNAVNRNKEVNATSSIIESGILKPNKVNSNWIAMIQMFRLCLTKIFQQISSEFTNISNTEEDPDQITYYFILIINNLNLVNFSNSTKIAAEISQSFNEFQTVFNCQQKEITDVNETINVMISHLVQSTHLELDQMLYRINYPGLDSMPQNLQPSYVLVAIDLTTISSPFSDSITIHGKNYHVNGFIFMDTNDHYSIAVKADDSYVIFNDDAVSRCMDRDEIERMYELACTVIYEQ